MPSDTWIPETLGGIAKGDYGLIDGPFGSRLLASDYTEKGIPVIRGSNLTLGDSRFRGEEFVFVSEATARRLNRSACHSDDIVFTKKGTIGQTGIIPDSLGYDSFLLSSNQMKLTVDPSKAIPLFVYYFVSSPTSRKKIVQDASGMGGVPKINLAYIRKFPILLPPLDEQIRIVGILEAIDKRIVQLSDTNSILEAIGRAIFKSWFFEFDRVHVRAGCQESLGMDAAASDSFPGEFQESSLGKIPKGWEISNLGSLMSMQAGKQPPAAEFESEPRDGYVRLLQIRDYANDSHRTYVPVKKHLRIATADDVLIGRYGAGSGDVKKDSLGRFLRGLEGAINVAIVKVVPKKLIYREWISVFVESGLFYKAIVGGSSRAETAGFRQEDLANVKIAMPPDSVFEEFDAIARVLWQRRQLIRKMIGTLASLRDTLLPRLISGKLQVPEAG